MREWADAALMLAMVLGSTLLGFVQEYRASNAVAKLRSQVAIKSSVRRGGQPQMLPSEQVVPGDVVTHWGSELRCTTIRLSRRTT